MENLFAKRLSELLEEKNISKRECARQTNLSAQSISDWSTGKIQPTAESIFIIAKYFNVSTDYLLGKEDDFGNTIKANKELSSKEQKLLKNFSLLSNDEQDKIIEDCIYFANKNTKNLKRKA